METTLYSVKVASGKYRYGACPIEEFDRQGGLAGRKWLRSSRAPSAEYACLDQTIRPGVYTGELTFDVARNCHCYLFPCLTISQTMLQIPLHTTVAKLIQWTRASEDRRGPSARRRSLGRFLFFFIFTIRRITTHSFGRGDSSAKVPMCGNSRQWSPIASNGRERRRIMVNMTAQGFVCFLKFHQFRVFWLGMRLSLFPHQVAHDLRAEASPATRAND